MLHTPLHDWHAAHRGRMVDFAGWSMPVQYGSIVDEHRSVRSAAGIFDVSHMGRLRFEGPNASLLLERLLTRRVNGMPVGRVRYSLVTNEQGGILDDVLVYHLERPGDGTFLQLVVNASNREKIVRWIAPHVESIGQVIMTDLTFATAMIAVQGPRALELAQSLVATDLSRMPYYSAVVTTVEDVEAVVSRTGYTGEDGCELIVPASVAVGVWEHLCSRGASPIGLGARDTLRLEAAMPLYGHELSEAINPFEAGLDFAVNLEGRAFVGREALAQIASRPRTRRRVGLELAGKRVPREEYVVFAGEDSVGRVTSGTFSPTRERPIAMAYVDDPHAAPGTSLTVDIRGQREVAKVVPLPFYERPRGAGG